MGTMKCKLAGSSKMYSAVFAVNDIDFIEHLVMI